MFERYTETARRTIFFARYEASQFGCPYIETEHLLLGVLREDKALAIRLLGSHGRIEEIRNAIALRGGAGAKIATSVDLPLSHESKRALAYGSEESERLNQKHIGPEHLLLGLLREQNCAAAELLRQHGVTIESVREVVRESLAPQDRPGSLSVAAIDDWLAEREAEGKWIVENRSGRKTGSTSTYYALYAVNEPQDRGDDSDLPSTGRLARIQTRLRLIVKRMERAIANHEFEKARFYSEEERKERENLRRLCDELNLEAPPTQIPLVCIAVIGNDLFSEVRARCEADVVDGVAEVWIVDPGSKRAYTVSKADGLCEFKGEILRIEKPPLEINLSRIFK